MTVLGPQVRAKVNVGHSANRVGDWGNLPELTGASFVFR